MLCQSSWSSQLEILLEITLAIMPFHQLWKYLSCGSASSVIIQETDQTKSAASFSATNAKAASHPITTMIGSKKNTTIPDQECLSLSQQKSLIDDTDAELTDDETSSEEGSLSSHEPAVTFAKTVVVHTVKRFCNESSSDITNKAERSKLWYTQQEMRHMRGEVTKSVSAFLAGRTDEELRGLESYIDRRQQRPQYSRIATYQAMFRFQKCRSTSNQAEILATLYCRMSDWTKQIARERAMRWQLEAETAY